MKNWSVPVIALATVVGIAMQGPAQSQDGPKRPAPQKGTSFITLGTTAGPQPRKDRAQASNLLIVNGTNYLIDAGDGVARRIVQADVDFLDVGTVFITHNHSDHTAGLATLLNAQWEYERREPTNVYGPPGTERLIKAAIQYFTVNAEIRSTEGKLRPLSTIFVGHDVAVGPVYQDANVKVTAVENSHYNFPEGSVYRSQHKSYSYRFETPDRVIVFTGDTGPSNAVAQLAKGADVLVSETIDADEVKQRRIANGSWQKMTPEAQTAWMKHITDEHLTPEEVGKLAVQAGVKSVVLTHLPATENKNNDDQKYAEKVKTIYKGPVTVAKDLMRF